MCEGVNDPITTSPMPAYAETTPVSKGLVLFKNLIIVVMKSTVVSLTKNPKYVIVEWQDGDIMRSACTKIAGEKKVGDTVQLPAQFNVENGMIR